MPSHYEGGSARYCEQLTLLNSVRTAPGEMLVTLTLDPTRSCLRMQICETNKRDTSSSPFREELTKKDVLIILKVGYDKMTRLYR